MDIHGDDKRPKVLPKPGKLLEDESAENRYTSETHTLVCEECDSKAPDQESQRGRSSGNFENAKSPAASKVKRAESSRENEGNYENEVIGGKAEQEARVLRDSSETITHADGDSDQKEVDEISHSPRKIAIEYGIKTTDNLMLLFEEASTFLRDNGEMRREIVARNKQSKNRTWRSLRNKGRRQQRKRYFDRATSLPNYPFKKAKSVILMGNKKVRYFCKKADCGLSTARAHGYELAHDIPVRVLFLIPVQGCSKFLEFTNLV